MVEALFRIGIFAVHGHGVALYENRQRRSSLLGKMSQSRTLADKNNNISQSFMDWYSSPLGERVAHNERDALSTMVRDLFGYQLLQVGELGTDTQYLDNCPIRRKLLVTHRTDANNGSVIVAQAPHLPIASDSVDAAILVHTLDFSPEPHQVLREVERVLIAEGRVIVVGFNPFSLWGLWRQFGRWRDASGDIRAKYRVARRQWQFFPGRTRTRQCGDQEGHADPWS